MIILHWFINGKNADIAKKMSFGSAQSLGIFVFII